MSRNWRHCREGACENVPKPKSQYCQRHESDKLAEHRRRHESDNTRNQPASLAIEQQEVRVGVHDLVAEYNELVRRVNRPLGAWVGEERRVERERDLLRLDELDRLLLQGCQRGKTEVVKGPNEEETMSALSPSQVGLHRAFAAEVATEIERQKALFPANVNSLHEGYGVLLEEVDELWDEVRKKQGSRVRSEVLKELVQIAAFAARIAVELDLIDPPPYSE